MTFILVFILFIIVTILMALGVIFSNKPLKGSCGGQKVVGFDGKPIACFGCPNILEEKTCKK